MENNYSVSEEQALAIIKNNYSKAEEILKNEDKVEKFLLRLENKLKNIPIAGNKLSEIPMLISLVRQYVSKEYTNIPIGTLIAVIGALLYVLSHFDLIPDTIPGVGLLDDIAVLAACLKLVESDIVEYNNWRKENGFITYDFVVEAVEIK